MKTTTHIAALAALGVASAASGQDAHPDLSGQYDGNSDHWGSVRMCGAGPPNPDCTELPLTAEGEAVVQAYNSDAYQAAYGSNCTVARMPATTLPGRYLMRLRQDGDVVHLMYQRTDTIRTVHMSAEPPSADFPHTRLGYSTGLWDGATLVVETTHLTGGNLGTAGFPYSERARVTERFWKEPGEEALNIEVTLEDPANYTRPFVLYRYRFESQPDWAWTPWNCTIL